MNGSRAALRSTSSMPPRPASSRSSSPKKNATSSPASTRGGESASKVGFCSNTNSNAADSRVLNDTRTSAFDAGSDQRVPRLQPDVAVRGSTPIQVVGAEPSRHT